MHSFAFMMATADMLMRYASQLGEQIAWMFRFECLLRQADLLAERGVDIDAHEYDVSAAEAAVDRMLDVCDALWRVMKSGEHPMLQILDQLEEQEAAKMRKHIAEIRAKLEREERVVDPWL